MLDQISVVIEPGKAIMLVGENGADKSTIVKLLADLYQPAAGQILFDGVNINTLDRVALRSYLSVIFQDFTVYHLSAQENIGVDSIETRDNRTRVDAAAECSGLDTMIARLPNRYQTTLGRLWDRGHELSRGQRQLVALARALFRGAPVLILDEPSAALDMYTEQRFFQRLLLGLHQTTLFISHRFTSVQRADRILVLEYGRIVEQESHEVLMEQNGRYAEVFKLQAQCLCQPPMSVGTSVDRLGCFPSVGAWP